MGGGRGKLSKVVAGVVLALLLAACAGGSGPDNPPSASQLAHSAFIDRSAFICQSTLDAQQQLPAQPDDLAKLKPGSPEMQVYARAVNKSAALSRSELGKLRKLLASLKSTMPAAQRLAFSKYLTSLAASVQVTQNYADTLRTDGFNAAERGLQHGSVARRADQLPKYATQSKLEWYCGGTKPPKTITATVTTPTTASTPA